MVLIGWYESGKNITSLENKTNVFSFGIKICSTREYTFSKKLLCEMLGIFSMRDFTFLDNLSASSASGVGHGRGLTVLAVLICRYLKSNPGPGSASKQVV